MKDSLFNRPDNIAEFLASMSDDDLARRIDALPLKALPGTNHDEFGFSRETLAAVAPLMKLVYRHWHRVGVFGAENVPECGPALIISNHSGMYPMDAMMILSSMILDAEPPRLLRSLVDRFVPATPFLSSLFNRVGQLVGAPGNADLLMERDELVLVFPEGAHGTGKTWNRRYRLQKFSPGFVELSITYRAPIIPVAVIGAEEQQPILYDVKPLAKALGVPYFPLTPTFPWFGPLGAITLPSKYRIYYGEPIRLFDTHGVDALEDPRLVRALMQQVRVTIQRMIFDGLKKRPAPFF